VLANNIANNAGDMVQSVALETTVGVTAANLFSRANFTAAVFTLGDHFGVIKAIAVHSVVFKRMVDNDDITFERPSQVDPNIPISAGGGIPYFLGKRVWWTIQCRLLLELPADSNTLPRCLAKV
jgi:hypothetical protein